MSPSVEQTDATFLYFIKQKLQCLDPSDATVLLLVDEIHLKQYLDYKGGNIVDYHYCGSSSEGLDSRSNNIDSDVKALSCQLAQYLLSHDLFG